MARAKNQKIKKEEDVDVLFLRLFSNWMRRIRST